MQNPMNTTSGLRLVRAPAEGLLVPSVATGDLVGDLARVATADSPPVLGTEHGARPKIDMHHHYCAPEWREWAERHELIDPRQLPRWAGLGIEEAVRFMDGAGITTAVLKPMLPARYRSSAQLREAITITLRSMVEVSASHPGRFLHYVPLFLDDLDSSSWAIRRGLGQLGAVGVNVTANYGGVYLGDPPTTGCSPS